MSSAHAAAGALGHSILPGMRVLVKLTSGHLGSARVWRRQGRVQRKTPSEITDEISLAKRVYKILLFYIPKFL
jgi:hypothetical protein